MVNDSQTTRDMVFSSLASATATTTANVKTVTSQDDRWSYLIEIATRYARKVPIDDRQDTLHDILIELAHAEKRDNEPLPIARARKIASLCVAGYWRKRQTPRPTITLETSLDSTESDADTIADTIADTATIDLDSSLDAKITLRGCPDRIVKLGERLVSGESLDGADRVALWQFRKTHKR